MGAAALQCEGNLVVQDFVRMHLTSLLTSLAYDLAAELPQLPSKVQMLHWLRRDMALQGGIVPFYLEINRENRTVVSLFSVGTGAVPFGAVHLQLYMMRYVISYNMKPGAKDAAARETDEEAKQDILAREHGYVNVIHIPTKGHHRKRLFGEKKEPQLHLQYPLLYFRLPQAWIDEMIEVVLKAFPLERWAEMAGEEQEQVLCQQEAVFATWAREKAPQFLELYADQLPSWAGLVQTIIDFNNSKYSRIRNNCQHFVIMALQAMGMPLDPRHLGTCAGAHFDRMRLEGKSVEPTSWRVPGQAKKIRGVEEYIELLTALLAQLRTDGGKLPKGDLLPYLVMQCRFYLAISSTTDPLAEDRLVSLHAELFAHFVVYYDQVWNRTTPDFRYFPVRKAGCLPPPPRQTRTIVPGSKRY